MKKNISVEQWNELGLEKQQKLIPWLIGEGGAKEITTKHYTRYFTIGKMIEILGDKLYCMTRNEVTNGWYIIIGKWNGWRIDKPELVDCLWIAIKKKINE